MSPMKAYARMDSANMLVRLIDVPVPEIAEDEVLVALETFGVGIHDRYFIPADATFPYVIGVEGVGRIAAAGSQVTDHRIGERVAFTSPMHPKGGTWAEYAAVKRTGLIALRDDLASVEAATVPIAGRTALQGVADLDLSPGETLFIAGASGAIGTFAIQLAVAQGVHVAGSASPRNHDYMRSLGAEMAVDYNAAGWQAQVRDWSGGGVDAALAIQPKTEADAIKVVRDDGRVITVSGYDGKVLSERGITIAQMTFLHAGQQEVERLLSAIADGSIRVTIEAEYPFDRALEALEKTETRHARGKLVVKMME